MDGRLQAKMSANAEKQQNTQKATINIDKVTESDKQTLPQQQEAGQTVDEGTEQLE